MRPPHAEALAPSELVSIVAPAGPFDRPSFEAGRALLEARYRVHAEPDLYAQERYLAGDDTRRLRGLTFALCDPSIRAVFAARGGYGTMRLLEGLPWADIGPRLVVGFSDLTALHLALARSGLATIHGPVLTQLGRQPQPVVDRLFAMLESTSTPPPPLFGSATFVPGVVEGRLLGGNLSVFSRLLGTPFMPDLKGAVLLLEDVGERPYRLDRMWTHLRLAGVFRDVRGIVLGDFNGCEEKDAPYSCSDLLRELATAAGLPCAAGFPIGHAQVNMPVPLNMPVRLDADRAELSFLEAPAVAT